jgi:hypothetical protein
MNFPLSFYPASAGISLDGQTINNICRPFYVRGCAVGCGLSGLIVILALGLHFKLEHENRRRDRLYGKPEENVAIDVTQGGDGAQNFRYMT